MKCRSRLEISWIRQLLAYNNLISYLIMVSDFWNEIHIPQRMWKCLVHFVGLVWLDPGHAHCSGPPLHIDLEKELSISSWSGSLSIRNLMLMKNHVKNMLLKWIILNLRSKNRFRALWQAPIWLFYIFLKYGQVGWVSFDQKLNAD